MSRFSFKTAVAALSSFAALALPALAQGQPPNPAGQWRCMVQSTYVNIDMMYQLGQNGQLQGRGQLNYVGTAKIYQIQGQGQWTATPPDRDSDQWLYRFQIQPRQGHAMFSVFARPTNNPGQLYNYFVNPQDGGVAETSCQRMG